LEAILHLLLNKFQFNVLGSMWTACGALILCKQNSAVSSTTVHCTYLPATKYMTNCNISYCDHDSGDIISVYDLSDSPENGYNPLSDPPCSSPEPTEENSIEMETSELSLPVLYRLRCEPPGERWVLLQDLTQLLRVKSRDALLRQLCAEAKSVLREFKMADFLDQARSCHVACGGEKINIRASKVALVRYNDKVRQLLGVEKITVGFR